MRQIILNSGFIHSSFQSDNDVITVSILLPQTTCLKKQLTVPFVEQAAHFAERLC